MVQKIFNDAKRDIERFAENAVKETREAFERDLPKLAEKAFDETKEAFEKELPDLAEKVVRDFLEELAQAITKEGLKKFRSAVKTAKQGLDNLGEKRERLTEQIDSLSVYLELGPATLTWDAFYSRSDAIIEALDRNVNSPPSFKRDEVLRLIEALGPTSINLGISVNFALVVGSKELGVGGGIGDIPLALFTEIADAIMDSLGCRSRMDWYLVALLETRPTRMRRKRTSLVQKGIRSVMAVKFLPAQGPSSAGGATLTYFDSTAGTPAAQRLTVGTLATGDQFDIPNNGETVLLFKNGAAPTIDVVIESKAVFGGLAVAGPDHNGSGQRRHDGWPLPCQRLRGYLAHKPLKPLPTTELADHPAVGSVLWLDVMLTMEEEG